MTLDWLTILLGVVPAYYLSIFLHEAGHAVMGWCTGYRVTSFGVGLGRPWWVIQWRGVRIYFCPHRSSGGLTWLISPQIHPSRWRLIGMLAGGCLANGLTALVALALWRLLPGARSFWLVLIGVSGWFGLNSLIPVWLKLGKLRLQTDGARILQAFWRDAPNTSHTELIGMVAATRHHWQAVGDRQIMDFCSLAVAAVWAEFGDRDHARGLLAEADGLSVDRSPFVNHFAALVRCGVERDPGNGGNAEILAEVEQQYAAAGDESGLFCVELQRAEWLLHEGNTAAACTKLEALQQHRALTSNKELRAELLVAELRAYSVLSRAKDVEQRTTEYEQVRHRWPSWSRDLQVYRVLAEYHNQVNEKRALKYYLRALAAAEQILHALPEGEDRDRFRNSQLGLLHEAERCLRLHGEDDEADQLARTYLPSAVELAEVRQRTLEPRSRRYYRQGLFLTLMSFLVGLLFAGLSILLSSDFTQGKIPPELWAIGVGSAFLHTTCSLGAFLLQLLLLLARRNLPWLDAAASRWCLYLGFLPWLIWGVTLAVWCGSRLTMP